jgi:RNA polymerase sigma factor (sigma-70 family)
MTTAPTHGALRCLRRLAEGPTGDRRPDRDLLARFRDAHDGDAFAALVRRHGPMVLGVCRRVLADPHAAEDACQSTFLVLIRRAGSVRWQASVGGWLHAVARRTALRARAVAARRRTLPPGADATGLARSVEPLAELTARELPAVLDEELARLPAPERSALVLCYLEGLTRDEAAARLGWSVGTLKRRLEFGRRRLRDRLSARGLALPAALTATLVAGPGALPAALSAAILRTTYAAGARLASGRLAAGLVVALVLGVAAATAGALGRPAADPPSPPPPAAAPPAPAAAPTEVEGRVLGPDGQPVAGARVILTKDWDAPDPAAQTVTDAEGRFRLPRAPVTSRRTFQQVMAVADGCGPDWADLNTAGPGELTLRLPKDDVPVEGRVLDLEGRPVPGASVRLTSIEASTDGIGSILNVLKTRPFTVGQVGRRCFLPAAAELGKAMTTGPDGRFRISGVGRDRVAVVRVEGPAIEHQTVRALTYPGFDPKTVGSDDAMRVMPGMPRQPQPKVFGPGFDLAVGPTKPITGVVRDAKTGEPRPGVKVNGSANEHWWENYVHATTDAHGRYTLVGLAKSPAYRLTLFAGDDSPYLPAGQAVSDSAGLAPITADMVMAKGVFVRGRITDRATGQPIHAGLRYVPLADNKFFVGLPGNDFFRFVSQGHDTDEDGRFRFPVLPGPGVILAQARDDHPNRYAPAHVRPEDRARASRGNGFESFTAAAGHLEPLMGNNDYALIDPPAGAESVVCDIQFEPGRELTGRVLGPDGQPLAGALVAGLTGVWDQPTTLSGSEFRAHALTPDRPRTLTFLHKERKLAGVLVVRGDEKGPPAVTLRPWGVLTGRVLGPDGQPLAGVTVGIAYRDLNVGALLMQAMSSPNGPPARYLQTDADGRFRMEGVVPGESFGVGFSKGFMALEAGRRDQQMTVGPGETKDLGDVRTKAGG